MRHAPITAALHSFEAHIERPRGNLSNGAIREYEIEVSYRIHHAVRVTAITPPEPASIEIVRVTGVDFDLTDWELDELEEQAAEHHREMIEDEADSIHAERAGLCEYVL